MKTFLRKIPDKPVRDALRYSIWDGILWAMMFGAAESYLVPLAHFFHASALQMSLIQGAAFLGVCLAQLLGSRIALKLPHRKPLIVWVVRLHALSWLGIFGLTAWTQNPWYILLMYFLGVFAANLGSPGWMSWMNDLVPPQMRGQFWGLRNKMVGLLQFVTMAVAGLALQLAKPFQQELWTYGALFGLAFLTRVAGSCTVQWQYEPPRRGAPTTGFHFHVFLTKLLTTNFGRFALFNFWMSFAINLMTPIVNVYVLQALHFNYFQFTAVNIAMMLASFFSMTYWGPLSDRYGNYRILTVTALALPFVAFGWVGITNFYALFVLQCFNGFVTAGMNLSMVNYMFDAVLPQNVVKISAYFNTLHNLFAFGGTLLAGLLTQLTPTLVLPFFAPGNYELIFLLSGCLRLLILCHFLPRFKEVRSVEHAPSIQYFYVYKPMSNMINRFQVLKTIWNTER